MSVIAVCIRMYDFFFNSKKKNVFASTKYTRGRDTACGAKIVFLLLTYRIHN